MLRVILASAFGRHCPRLFMEAICFLHFIEHVVTFFVKRCFNIEEFTVSMVQTIGNDYVR